MEITVSLQPKVENQQLHNFMDARKYVVDNWR